LTPIVISTVTAFELSSGIPAIAAASSVTSSTSKDRSSVDGPERSNSSALHSA
jgi:hypothetical protein